jgi:type IV pilus assembly protein PilM
MSLLRRGKKDEAPKVASVVGVDLGTSSIKVVEMVAEQGKPRLLTYGYGEIEDGAKTVADVLPAEQIGALLKELFQQAGVQGGRVVASLPTAQVFQAVVSVPTPKQSEELRALVEAQISKLLPTPLAEVALDSQVIGEAQQGDQSYTRVLVTAVPKTLITQYEQLFTGAGLQLLSLETEVAALSRSLLGPEQGVAMVVDIGGERTTVAVCENGVPMVVRGIKSGGQAVTQAFSRSLNVSSVEAESMKRDLSPALSSTALPPALLEAVKSIVHELRYTKQLYADQRGQSVQKVLLTGGGSLLPSLATYLSQELNVNTYVADPWARVAAPPEARGLLEEVGGRLAVAVGLAMRVAEEL